MLLKHKIKALLSKFRRQPALYIFICFAVIFAILLMFSTFYFENGQLFVSYAAYSDFLSHLPLIRSFSLGDNIPPEFPYFPGEPIKYHFFFYFLVGLLEKIGVRTDFALNMLSIVGFAGLMIVVYLLAKKLSKSSFVAFCSGLLVIFNSSLSWIYYFFIGENRVDGLLGIFQAKQLAAFGPYNDAIISAFWNLNIYTSQRHFAFALATAFIAIWFIVYKKGSKYFLIGIFLIAIMAWLHKAVLLLLFLSLGVFLITEPTLFKKLFLAITLGLVAALPGLLFLSQGNISDESFLNIVPGFLYKSTTWWELSKIDSDVMKWIIYWVMNVGVIPLLALAGFITTALDYKSPKGLKKLGKIWVKLVNKKTAWFYIATASFILANVFSFGKDIANNHKLINFALIIWGIYAFIFLKQIIANFRNKLKYIPVVVLLLCVFAGGICDMFPIFNDAHYGFEDYSNTLKGKWIASNTEPRDVFLNLSEESLFILLSGRKVNWGGRYFNWSLGYDQDKKYAELSSLIESKYDKEIMCKLIKNYKIKYIYLNLEEEKLFDYDLQLDNFITQYGEGLVVDDVVRMYDIKEICK